MGGEKAEMEGKLEKWQNVKQRLGRHSENV